MPPFTITQPYTALVFVTGGFVAYAVYELLAALKLLSNAKLLEFITDFFAVLFAGGLFVLLSDAFIDGKIEFFTVFSFLTGIIALRLMAKPLLRKAFCALSQALRPILKRVRAYVYKSLKSLQANIRRTKNEHRNKTKRRKKRTGRVLLRGM